EELERRIEEAVQYQRRAEREQQEARRRGRSLRGVPSPDNRRAEAGGPVKGPGPADDGRDRHERPFVRISPEDEEMRIVEQRTHGALQSHLGLGAEAEPQREGEPCDERERDERAG